jgi:uncharacterized repeat protein (TIGR02543 family)
LENKVEWLKKNSKLFFSGKGGKKLKTRKLFTMIIIFCLVSTQFFLPVFVANAIGIDKTEETTEQETNKTTTTTAVETVASEAPSIEAKQNEQEETKETKQSEQEETKASTSEKQEAELPAVRATSENFANFDGVSLSGENDSVSIHNYQSSIDVRTLTVSAEFETKEAVTSRTLEVEIENGLAFSSLPGMKATDSNKSNWQFDESILPTQLQGVIVNATYVPNQTVAGYQSRAGKIVYKINSDINSVIFSAGIVTDRTLNVAKSSLTLNTPIVVKSIENDTVIQEEKLESMILNGDVYPVLYSGGHTQNLSLKPGEKGTITKEFYESNDKTPLLQIYAVVDKIEYVFKVNKNAGIKEVTFPTNASASSAVIDRTRDAAYDYVTVTLDKVYLNRATGIQAINFYYEVPADAVDGTYYLTLESAKITANGQEINDTTSWTSARQTINVASASQVKLTDVTNKYFVYDPLVTETNMTTLGGFALSNIGAESANQKVRMTFTDENIGVRAVSLPHEAGGAATDVVVKTNKGQTFTKAKLQGNAMHSNYRLYRYNLLLSSLGTVAKDEYITEVSYNMGKIPAGEISGSSYRGSLGMVNTDYNTLPIAYHGYLLNVPASKTFSASTTIVDADKEFNDDQALSVTNVMNVVDPQYTTFVTSSNISNSTQFLSGSTHTISANLNVIGFTYQTTSASVIKGFDVYLRGGEYLNINTDSIAVVYEGETYSVANGKIVATASVDNAGYPLYKIELPDVLLGRAKGDSFSAFSGIHLTYDVKVKSSAPTTYISGNELIQIFAKNLKTSKLNGGNSMYNNPDIYDVNGNGDIDEYVGTLSYQTGIQLIEQKDFSVITSVNLNDGPWVSYDYKTNMDIINLNPSGEAKYQLSISNNSGASIDGYTALIPIPKAGEKTDLTPNTASEFDVNRHIQKTAFGWTASLLEEIVPSEKLNYEILYATSYETDKDSTKFKTWDEIGNKNDIRMVKVVTKDAIPDGTSDAVIFKLALTDPDADLHAGKTNIYSARIYRNVLGNVGYTPSEPVAIRLKTGVIKGQVFNDINRNGLKEATETGANGVTVHAYETGSNRTKLIESTLTKKIGGVDGCYELTGLDKDQNVDIVFVNPTIDDSTRFSPVTLGGSTPTPDNDQRNAQTTKVTPSGTGFDMINAGIIRPIKITLNAGEGTTAQETVKKYPGEAIEAEPKAELKGKTFIGWYTQETGGTKVSFPYTAGANDVTLYARYVNNSYKVIYNIDGTTEETTANYDSLLTKPEDPSKDGYTFTGWYTEATGGEKWDFATDKMSDHDLTLYARFSAGNYTLTFNVDGITSTQAVEFDTLVSQPEDPSKAGYTFAGWYTETTGGEKWDFATDKMPAHDVTLYAHFTVNEYTVTFVNDGETDTQAVNYDTLVTEPTIPVKMGYTFNGWYTEVSGGEEWNFSVNKMPSNNLTLYARFTVNQYTLTFDDEGEISTQLVNYDTLVTEPEAPTKAGYSFIGWYDAQTGGKKWNFNTDKMPANDHTLYARYGTNTYTVTYNNQGKTETETVVFGELLTEPKKPAKAGYRFGGWYEAVDDIIWNFKLDKIPARDFTLIAQFIAEDQTITFDTDGGSSVEDIVALTDSPIDLDRVTTPTKKGYQFIGWFDENDKQITGTIKMPAGGMSLKAKWTASDQVIIFNTDGGTSVASLLLKTNETFDIDDQITTRAGYTFDGWYDEANELVTGVQTVKAGGATYEAKWTAQDQTITFDLNGGDPTTQPESITAPTDSEVELDNITQPTRSGYQFIGWFDENDKQITGMIKMPAGGLKLKAKWQAEEQLIQFNANGGTSIPALRLTVDETYDLDQQVTSRAGYSFQGWYNEADERVSGVQTVIKGGATYTANWQAEDQTIVFDVNGGDVSTQPESITAPTDSDINLDEISLPTRAGYQFIGWFAGDHQVTGIITMPAGGMKLKAKWLADEQTIQFKTDGGTPVTTLTVKTGETYDLDKQITLKAGYLFLGWYNEVDELVTGKQIATHGGALYTAKWKAADQTITFDINGGDPASQPAAIKAPSNSKVDLAKVKQPTRTGYTFTGWHNNKTYVAGIITMPVGGMTLKANWQKNIVNELDANNKSSKNITKTSSGTTLKSTAKNKLPSTGEKVVANFMGYIIISGAIFLIWHKKQKRKTKK